MRPKSDLPKPHWFADRAVLDRESLRPFLSLQNRPATTPQKKRLAVRAQPVYPVTPVAI
ncbi:MAG: hypothetical protein MK364_04520 [Pirellulales bacterium]|nr:hypothetical protein [Pirellulales bacterium]